MTYKIIPFVFCVFLTFQAQAQGGGGGIGIYIQQAGISGQDNSNMFSGDGLIKYGQSESTTPQINKEALITFSPLFDDALIDTFWKEFRYLDSKVTISNDSSNRIIVPYELKRKYLYLLKLMAGDSFMISNESKYIIKDTGSNKRTAELVCKVRSSKAAGYMDILFTLSNDHKITLHQMDFFPFDHSSNDFIYSLTGNELYLVNAQQMSKVIDTVLRYADNDKYAAIRSISRKLSTIKLAPNPLFTYRLFMERGELWVMSVFDTDRPDVHLNISYKLINKKFKPAFVEVLKKE